MQTVEIRLMKTLRNLREKIVKLETEKADLMEEIEKLRQVGEAKASDLEKEVTSLKKEVESLRKLLENL